MSFSHMINLWLKGNFQDKGTQVYPSLRTEWFPFNWLTLKNSK